MKRLQLLLPSILFIFLLTSCYKNNSNNKTKGIELIPPGTVPIGCGVEATRKNFKVCYDREKSSIIPNPTYKEKENK